MGPERWTINHGAQKGPHGDEGFFQMIDGPLTRGPVEVVRDDAYRGVVEALRRIVSPAYAVQTEREAMFVHNEIVGIAREALDALRGQ